jgi:predicted glycosyltransferase
MLRNRLYYSIKPLVPLPIRFGIRRWFAVRKRRQVDAAWPIMPGSERPPEGWPGWPEGKQFALVLTHDVEGPSGLDKVTRLMRLESQLGFRSSFNLIPEGPYRVPREFREQIESQGFEVGVHDLYHDGKLFLTRNEFNRRAVQINHYLKDWGAAGFRSGFMLHNLDWVHELDLQYDASTFDTDPFEPQPQGRNTIFPFWVPRPADGVQGSSTLRSTVHPPQWCYGGRATEDGKFDVQGSRFSSTLNPQPSTLNPQPSPGYAELPYTLPQDSTLFLLLEERHPDIWFQKLDWIARHGGMVLLDSHPDYMSFGGSTKVGREYPVSMYTQFLEYVRSRYAGAYWPALPREVARFVRGSRAAPPPPRRPTQISIASPSSRRPKIWIDLDNTPHVPFFEPILDELRARGFPVLVTARDAFQVCDLADKKGLAYVKIGRHYGKNRLMKGAGLAYRTLQLAPVVLREKPLLAVSHGARSQLLLCNCLRLPSVLIEDYEYCQFPPMMKPTWLMAPDVIPDSSLCVKNGHLRKYPGIKEDVYAWKLKPEDATLRQLGVAESDLVVTVRPPATEAHYHNPESERLFEAFMKRACQTPQVKVVLLPRNKKQAEAIQHQWPKWFEKGQVVIPSAALDGLNLIWHSDLVVSGGGTMNREAAALGVPVYSIFRGSIGAVDKHLQAEGRLVLIESVDDVVRKINLARRSRKSLAEVTSRRTLQFIVDAIVELAEQAASPQPC